MRDGVVVAEEATLRIAPGATVRIEPGRGVGVIVAGRLLIEGTPRAPVALVPREQAASGAAWEGIRLSGGRGGEHLLAGFRIEGAREGIAVTDARARLAGGAFASCGTGLRCSQKASVAADNCVFDGNDAGAVLSLGAGAEFSGCRFDNTRGVGIAVEKGAAASIRACSFARGKTGIFLLTDAPCRIEESAFASLGTAVAARQTGKDSSIRYCSFANNGTAVLAVQFCALEIGDCVFEGNQAAVDAREFSTPVVRHNRFERNGTAVNLFRKAHAVIEKNVFRHNRNAVVVNYSSYPRIAANDFDRNEMSVRLERFQSGDWEEREGSPPITAGEAQRRGSRRVAASGAAAAGGFPKRIFARGNFWGSELGRDPAQATLGTIWDGRKFGPVRYEGFGEKEYAIDVVDSSEASPGPIPGAGPRPREAKGTR